jgi:alkylhydroperoxidase/carboxymuconolactone decarboxylase family protein YurZ
MRIGQPAKLGVVMMRLLKSYGITDEEIIEALSMPAIS